MVRVAERHRLLARLSGPGRVGAAIQLGQRPTDGGQCEDRSRLIICLCQIAGIPARLVASYMWWDPQDNYAMHGGHAIVEIFLEGGWAFFESLKRGFYCIREDGRIASLWDILQHPELAERLHRRCRVHTYGSFYIADLADPDALSPADFTVRVSHDPVGGAWTPGRRPVRPSMPPARRHREQASARRRWATPRSARSGG